MLEKVLNYIRERHLLRPGERVAVACSGGADSVALLHILAELCETLGIVLCVAHFHHQIRGDEADLDQQFVQELSAQLQVRFHSASGNVPQHAAQSKISIETAARELRHQWFAELIKQGKADKIATAHTLDDQAETVLMRILRGTGARGLAGIAPAHKAKHLARPLLTTSRCEVEAYLKAKGQCWREDSTNLDLGHTRNRIRHKLLPLLEREFNPAIRQTLTDLAELARAEDEYWSNELALLLPRLVHEGKPSRSGRSSSGHSYGILALDLSALRGLPLAIRRQVFHATALQLGVSLEFKHIQQLSGLVEHGKSRAKLVLPEGLMANRTVREIQFGRNKQESPENYCYSLPIPGEVAVPEVGITIRARLITDGKQKASGYNGATLLNISLLGSKLTVRNWRAGDKFFPAYTQSPRKVKELLQPGRLGQELSPAQRKAWPVIESAGQIVWMRSFPVSHDFASSSGDAVLIEEIKMTTEAQE
ncbi:MAG: tRNA(Ile)-lysidine synthetase-like protein [Candidatus Angelobacter sp.]|nr:tRNA(Ile)-lysidine synthetase-like protein [Candidatus Angelobacter sp.]